MKIMPCGLTDVGRKRKQNEDSLLINEDLNLYIIADGMGGHSGGEFASRMAVQTIEETLRSITSDPEATVISGVNTNEARLEDKINYAIQIASKKIYERALYDTSLKGMGTTTVAAFFQDGKAYIAHVGDSRAYMFRDKEMTQITIDHSLVNEQVKAGLISKQDARGHKLKNVITRSVGYQEEVQIDVKTFDVQLGDKFLLCTDGLSNMVDDAEIKKTVLNLPLKEACRKLVDCANEKGGDDNITILMLVVTDPTG